MEIKNANIKSNSNSNNNNNDSISISNSIKGNWSDTSSRVKMGIRKKVLNINGVLFNIFTEDVEEVERYFSNFVTPCNEKVVATYNIYFDRDKDILDALVNSFNKKEAIVISTFKNQTHLKNGSQYLIDTEEYMCIKTNDNNYKLFGTIKGLSWIVRELLIREMEDKGYFYMHGTGIEVFDKGSNPIKPSETLARPFLISIAPCASLELS